MTTALREVLYPHTLRDLYNYLKAYCLRLPLVIHKCKDCGRYFVVTGNITQEYCTRRMDGSEKTCRQMGAVVQYRSRQRKNPATKEFTRSYKAHNARVRYGTMTKAEFTAWSKEARYTLGSDPETGKQIQKSVYGKTQKEVRQKLTAITAEIDDGTYMEPCRMTLDEWLDIWLRDYLTGVKPSTAYLYQRQAKLYIRPALGSVRLDRLESHTIQRFYNSLYEERDGKPPLSAKSIKNIHGILHKALQQAVLLNYLRTNPANACILPKIIKKEIHPMDDRDTALFLEAIKGCRYELLLKVDLFTGLREGELLGLMWDCVDFDKGTILVNKQLHRSQKKGEGYYFAPPKSNKSRTIRPAPYVMTLLRQQKLVQTQMRLAAISPCGQYLTALSARYGRSACPTCGSTTCATHMPSTASALVMTSRQCNPTSATLPPLLPLMSMAISLMICGRPAPSVWNSSSLVCWGFKGQNKGQTRFEAAKNP